MTTAAAPASSRRRMLSIVYDSGDDDGTMGFFSVSPRYSVRKSIAFSSGRQPAEQAADCSPRLKPGFSQALGDQPAEQAADPNCPLLSPAPQARIISLI